MKKPSKYQDYRKAASDLARLLNAITSGSQSVDTLGNIEGLPAHILLNVDKRNGHTVVTLWDRNNVGIPVTL